MENNNGKDANQLTLALQEDNMNELEMKITEVNESDDTDNVKPSVQWARNEMRAIDFMDEKEHAELVEKLYGYVPTLKQCIEILGENVNGDETQLVIHVQENGETMVHYYDILNTFGKTLLTAIYRMLIEVKAMQRSPTHNSWDWIVANIDKLNTDIPAAQFDEP